MEIQGKIIRDLGEQSGTSSRGNAWKKHEFVIETHDTYAKQVCITLFGDRADQYPIAVGEEVTVSFDLTSREYNGRWYTSVDGWKVEKTAAPVINVPVPPAGPTYTPPTPAGQSAAAAAPASDPFSAPAGGNDDLPF